MKILFSLALGLALLFDYSLSFSQDVRKKGEKKNKKPISETTETVNEKIDKVTISGKVIDESKSTLPGASILILDSDIGTLSGLDGNFVLKDVPVGKIKIRFSYIGYSDLFIDVDASKDTDLQEIILKEKELGLEEIQVVASYVRERSTPVAVSTMDIKYMEERMGSQELPQIAKLAPSVYSSNSGGGFGDSKIVLRGFQQEEIAVMINGVPVNDMAASRVFWSNWQGLGDVLRTTQIQRGLGASRLAISSVGGTMNFIIKTTDMEKGGSIRLETSNIYDFKSLVTVSTGLSPKGWAMTLTGGRTVGKGYIENLTIDAWSYYMSVSKQVNEKHLITFNIFGAPQKHGQRFTRLTEARFSELGNTQANVDFGYLNGQKINLADNFYHKPQTSLNHFWDITEKTKLSTSVYASWGRGGGSGTIGTSPARTGVNGTLDWEALQATNRNGVDTLITPNSKIVGYNASGILRDSRNDHDWYGLLSTLTSKINEKITLTGGIDGRLFKGHNYRTVKNLIGGDYWIEKNYANDSLMYLINVTSTVKTDTIKNGRVRRVGDIVDYDYNSFVNWIGTFGQAEFQNEKISSYVSFAVSNTWMKRKELMRKTDNPVSETKSFFAYTVKAGLNYLLNKNHNVFANFGHFTRAPFFRYALVDERKGNEFVNNLVNEKVYSAELGYGLRTKKLVADLNYYYTSWVDKGVRIAYNNPQGQLAYANIAGMQALHTGIELEGKYEINKFFTVNFMFQKGDWKWIKDVSATVINENDLTTQKLNLYLKGIKVGDAPQTSASLGLKVNLTKDIYLIADGIYHADMYANFNPELRTKEDDRSQSWKTPDFFLMDLHAGYNFSIGKHAASLRGHVFNLLNKAYFMEAQDGAKHNRATSTMFYGYGRTFNVVLNFQF